MNSRRPSFADLAQRDLERQQAQDLLDAQTAARRRSIEIADRHLAPYDERQRQAAPAREPAPAARHAEAVRNFMESTAKQAEAEQRAYEAGRAVENATPDPPQPDLLVDAMRATTARRRAIRRHPVAILRRGRPLD